MLELYPTTKAAINIGAFPLNHDCILKVVFTQDCGLRFQYFSCRAQDSGSIVLIISKLYCVKKLNVLKLISFNYGF